MHLSFLGCSKLLADLECFVFGNSFPVAEVAKAKGNIGHVCTFTQASVYSVTADTSVKFPA